MKPVAREDFVFEPGSPIWMINRELVLLLGGPKAAILQVALPEVAYGVAAHSAFKEDSYGRLRRTLEAVYDAAFGTREEAERMASRVHKIHAKVRGDSPKPYNAFSQGAQFWVLATLIVPGLEMYERFVQPVPEGWLPVYYSQMRTFGHFFGLRPDYGPQTWQEFREYYDAMLATDHLGSDPICAELAQSIASPRGPLPFELATRPLRFLAEELLESPVRERLGLHSKPSGRVAMRAVDLALPPLLRRLPRRLRFAPKYLMAEKLLAAGSAA